MKKIFLGLFLLSVVALGASVGFVAWGYNYITRDLPQLNRIEDYRPPTVSSVYAMDGTLIGEFFQERRYVVRLGEVPLFVRQAFISAEDSSFYTHPGIDIVSIFRAFWRNVQSGSTRQGGSTITQQVVKNLLLTPEKSIIRKAKEAILSYKLEQTLTKDEILEIYLNQIYLGNGAYGIKAAARSYFHKDPDKLTLAEAAILAGLPQAPSRYSPVRSMRRAKSRQRYVLDRMVQAGFISRKQADEAYAEDVKAYSASTATILAAPYFVSEVRRVFSEKFPGRDIDRDGYEIFTTVSLRAQQLATAALQEGIRVVDKREGWRGPVAHFDDEPAEAYKRYLSAHGVESVEIDKPLPALVLGIEAGQVKLQVLDQVMSLTLSRGSWPNQPDKVLRALHAGDVIEVSVAATKEAATEVDWGSLTLAQTPELEGALVLLEPSSGKVRALVGGYSYQRSQFNRATQALRQPGSAFKPIVYLSAVDGFHYSPSTIVDDTPRVFRVGNDVWEPHNFERNFLGHITLRKALEKSRNIVSADIIQRIGVDSVIVYAKKLGIESRLGRNLSLSLGSSEVTPLELTRAYGVIANRGMLVPSSFIDRVVDRQGKEIYSSDQQRVAQSRQVIPTQSAFIMANLMRGVIERGTGYRVRELQRPAAGKTGTSNDHMDAWFVGFTPEWACGVWIGNDVKKTIGDKETGGRVAAPIWLNFMKPFLEGLDEDRYTHLLEDAKRDAEELGIEYVKPDPIPISDFVPPDGVVGMWVNRDSGLPTSAEDPLALWEYFRDGNQPGRVSRKEATLSYLESPEL